MTSKQILGITQVFMSYNLKDKNLVKKLDVLLGKCGYHCIISDEIPEPALTLPEKVKKQITISSCVLAIYTRNSKDSKWVNQEIGYALGKENPVIPLSQKKEYIDALLQGTEYIEIDIGHPSIDGIINIITALEGVNKTRRELIGV